MSKYQALIDALESAQSSNWSHDGEADVYETDVGILVASAMETEDAAYIAAANPATIRALLADLERAEKAMKAIDSLDPHNDSTTNWNVALGEVRAALAQMAVG